MLLFSLDLTDMGPALLPVSGLNRGKLMNNIIYIIGLVVVVIFILGFFGLR